MTGKFPSISVFTPTPIASVGVTWTPQNPITVSACLNVGGTSVCANVPSTPEIAAAFDYMANHCN
jgi:hypothetical protein